MSVQQEFNAWIVEYLKGSPTGTGQIAADFGLKRNRVGKMLSRAADNGIIGRYFEANPQQGKFDRIIWTEVDGGQQTTLEELRLLPRDPFAHMVARLA